MSEPFWLAAASAACPEQAAELRRESDALRELPRHATTAQFVAAYERMLVARDRLYAAWIAAELAELGPEVESAVCDPEGPLLVVPPRQGSAAS